VTLDEIRALGPGLAELCEKYGIAELAVFGSMARGDERPDSDVDLLYEAYSGCSGRVGGFPDYRP
jgi:uncharacterized protein